MQIRDQTPDDASSIRSVVAAAFGQAHEADLVEALRASGDSVISLVAEQDGKIAGHILFSKLRAPEDCLALAPLSVAPAHRGRDLGSRLIREGLARAQRGAWRAVFVLGKPAYYERFGFRTETAEPFGTNYPKSYFMALELTPGALQGCAGAVLYPSAFDAVE